MTAIPLTVLSFFCLSLLFFVTLTWSLFVLCKFSQFIAEARIAKGFYISIVITCVVRTGCFGAATALYFKQYDELSNKIIARESQNFMDENVQTDSYKGF